MFTPYRPLEGGKLLDDHPLLRDIALSKGATPGQIALAWLLRRSSVVVVIPGTHSMAHLEETVAALALASELTEDEVTSLTGPAPFAARGA